MCRKCETRMRPAQILFDGEARFADCAPHFFFFFYSFTFSSNVRLLIPTMSNSLHSNNFRRIGGFVFSIRRRDDLRYTNPSNDSRFRKGGMNLKLTFQNFSYFRSILLDSDRIMRYDGPWFIAISRRLNRDDAIRRMPMRKNPGALYVVIDFSAHRRSIYTLFCNMRAFLMRYPPCRDAGHTCHFKF